MNSADNLALLGRVMGGLIVVLVLIGLAARVARRARGTTGTSGLRVVDRVGLSREANLAVVEVGNRVLLLGVTAQGVSMLADLDELPGSAAQTPQRAAEPEPDFEADLEFAHAEPEIDLVEQEFVLDPEFVDAPEPSSHRPVPTGIALDQYPDLASALRAAGRTTESSSTASTSFVKMAAARHDDTAAGSTLALSGPRTSRPTAAGSRPVPITPSVPRTRAEARAEAQALARAAALEQDPVPAAASRKRMLLRRRADRPVKPKIVSSPSTVQASGSVLSPQTWRQGVDALRDLTVRRG